MDGILREIMVNIDENWVHLIVEYLLKSCHNPFGQGFRYSPLSLFGMPELIFSSSGGSPKVDNDAMIMLNILSYHCFQIFVTWKMFSKVAFFSLSADCREQTPFSRKWLISKDFFSHRVSQHSSMPGLIRIQFSVTGWTEILLDSINCDNLSSFFYHFTLQKSISCCQKASRIIQICNMNCYTLVRPPPLYTICKHLEDCETALYMAKKGFIVRKALLNHGFIVENVPMVKYLSKLSVLYNLSALSACLHCMH